MNRLFPSLLLTLLITALAALPARGQSADLQLAHITPESGSPGRTVMIYGAGFDAVSANNTVTFLPVGGGPGTSAAVTEGGSTFLHVTIPTGLPGGHYRLRVERTSDGTTTTSPTLFAVATGGGYFGLNGSHLREISSKNERYASVRAGDLDGDGDLDLVSASSLAPSSMESIVWYEHDGADDPTFTERVVASNDGGFSSVHVEDVDGDGDLDLIASSSSSDAEMAWYENDGAADPTFTERVVSASSGAASSVYAGDVDGDGDLDLVSATSADNKIAWFENDGTADPGFTEQIVSTTADAAQSVFAGDVDGDGDLDLMSASFSDDKIAWYENDGAADPAFAEHVVSTNADGAESIYAGDVDDDGDLDLMSASKEDNKIAWYENDNGFGAPGSSEHVVSTTAVSAAPGRSSVHAADVDGDGDLDLMSASGEDSEIVWYENNNGFGTPGASEHIVYDSAVLAQSVYAGDVDGDGDVDLIHSGSGQVAWQENTSPPLRITQVQPLTASPGNAVTLFGPGFDLSASDNTVTFEPVGGGSEIEATVTSANRNKLTVTVPLALGGGNYRVHVERASDGAAASYTPLVAVPTGGEGFGAPGSSEHVVSTDVQGTTYVHAGDVDGNGTVDIISVSLGDEKLAWHKNDGNQNFTEQVISTNGPTSVHTGDLDNDGDLDLVAGFYFDNKIAWFENDGAVDPGFTEHIVSASAGTTTSVFAGDVDGDGDLDLMAASTSSDKIAWYENDGTPDPAFTERVVSANANVAFGIHAEDIDGDGDLDVVSALKTDNRIAWYENDGAANPSFTEQVVTTTAENAQKVHVGDVDGDGDLDLMSAFSYENNNVAWYENDGTADPGFTERIVSTNDFGSSDVYAGDINGDGDLDLISASDLENKIAWFENDGSTDPAFTEQVVSTTVGNAQSVYAADIDGDGDLDLISASSADKIAWFENEGVPLPVELTAFEAARDGNAVRLTWQTASETNNAGFEIQAQESGRAGTWKRLAFVEGAGTTSEPQSYRYTAEGLDVGTYAFRLRQLDRDGTAALSPEVEVTLGLTTAYTLSEPTPNPSRGTAQLVLTVRAVQHVTVAAYDVLGRRVAVLYDGEIPANRTERLVFEGSRLPSGLYFVRAIGEDFAVTQRVTLVQ